MEFLVSMIAIALMVIGAFGVIFMKRPLDKIIMFDIMDAGFVLVVVLFKYLDVALFAALAGPLSTLVFILSIVKIKSVTLLSGHSIQKSLQSVSVWYYYVTIMFWHC